MGKQTNWLRGRRGWALLALPFLAVLAAIILTWGLQGGQPAEADTMGQTNFAVAIDVDNDGTDDCDTRMSTMGIGAKCSVLVGNMFTVKGFLDGLGTLPGTGGYIVFEFHFTYTTPGLVRNNRVEPAEEVGNPTYWEVTPGVPAVCTPNSETDASGMTGDYEVDCWQGTKSMYLGKLVEVDFTCTSAGMRMITMRDVGTVVHDQNHGQPADKDGDETLTINCSSTPTPTPTPKDPGGDTDGDTVLNGDDPDDDNDGCNDTQELGSNPSAGGMRNPHHIWDVFDTGTQGGGLGAGPNLLGVIGLEDVLNVAGHFGQTGSASIPLLSDASGAGYHTRFDRGGSMGPNTWNLAAANGSVNLGDVLDASNQFGLNC